MSLIRLAALLGAQRSSCVPTLCSTGGWYSFFGQRKFVLDLFSCPLSLLTPHFPLSEMALLSMSKLRIHFLGCGWVPSFHSRLQISAYRVRGLD